MDDKTIESVVRDALCTGCGSCIAICPNDAIKMVVDRRKGIYVPKLEDHKCNKCRLCYNVCPGHSVDFKQLNLDIFGNAPEDILLGNHLSCFLGHAIDNDIRYNSASGGLVTALLIYALEKKIIDGALVTRMSALNPLEPEPFIARTREEIISAAKSKYCPVPSNIALRQIIDEEGRFAIVGLPCHIEGIRKFESANKKIKQRIVLHLGILCNGTPTFLATEFLIQKVGLAKDKIKGIDYRGRGWPGKLRLNDGNGDIFYDHLSYYAAGFGSYFFSKRCKLCCDGGNDFADIAFGDAWNLPETANDKVGTSLIICRTAVGQKLLDDAQSRKIIELKEISHNDVKKSQPMLANKKSTANLTIFKLFGSKTPSYNIRLKKSVKSAYFRAVLYYVYWRLNIASMRHLWRFIGTHSEIKASANAKNQEGS